MSGVIESVWNTTRQISRAVFDFMLWNGNYFQRCYNMLYKIIYIYIKKKSCCKWSKDAIRITSAAAATAQNVLGHLFGNFQKIFRQLFICISRWTHIVPGSTKKTNNVQFPTSPEAILEKSLDTVKWCTSMASASGWNL